MEEQKKSLTIASLVLGIVGIVFDFIYPIIGIIAGIIGIVLSVQANKKEGKSGMATGGMVCSIVAVAIGGLMYACAICAVGTLLSIGASL